MTQTLFLTSAGIVPEVRKDFLSILKKKPEDVKVLSITTAAYGETKDPWWLKKDVELLHDCGIQHIEEFDLKDKNIKEVEKAFEEKDIVFVNGGNTFYLLHHVQKSGFDIIIKRFIKNGGIYVGVSAGTILANPTIEVAGWKNIDKNKVGLQNITALNFVDFLTFVHFNESYRQLVDEESKKTTLPIVAITDTQAILVQGKKVKIVGTGKKEYWNGFKES